MTVSDDDQISARANALREDLGKEYYALLNVVSEFDGRQLTVKGWSVTLSLAALGVGFQQKHYALFGLAAATALAFWFMDVLLKRFQLRYYSRMRDIEYIAFQLNAVQVEGMGSASAPRIDMSWSFKGVPGHRDWRTDVPERYTPEMVHRLLRRPYVMPQVLLPHAAAVVLGFALFVAAALNAPGLADLPL